MTTSPQISIIVPFFNAGQQLTRCLTALREQTFEDIEVILVNDCPTDEQDETTAKEFSDNDQRFIYLKHEKNKRQGGARNTGIRMASAEIVTFVDADDWVETNTYEKTIKKIKRTNADILTFGYRRVRPNGKRVSTDRIIKASNSSPQNSNLYTLFNPSCCNKLFKKSLFTENSVWFPENVKHEDLGTVPRLAAYANKISYTPYAYYNYTQQESSTNFSISRTNIDDYFYIFALLKDFLIKEGLFEQQRENHYRMIHGNIKNYAEFLSVNKADEHLRLLISRLSTMPDYLEYLKQFNSNELYQLLCPNKSSFKKNLSNSKAFQAFNNLLP